MRVDGIGIATGRGALALFWAGLAVCLCACGGVQYAVVVNSAASRVEEARALGAEQLAPYE
jgi:hypothetical protein